MNLTSCKLTKSYSSFFGNWTIKFSNSEVCLNLLGHLGRPLARHEPNIILDLFILSLLNLRDMAKRNVLSFYLINSPVDCARSLVNNLGKDEQKLRRNDNRKIWL